jgi:hypothetical protein
MRARPPDRSPQRLLSGRIRSLFSALRPQAPGLLLAGFVACSTFGVYSACTATPATNPLPTSIQPGTTSVSVDPSEFLGAIPCSSQPGSMQSFVATVTDVTGSFVLPSSPPTACSQSAFFEYIVIGDAFTAQVDGYEQPPDQLVPACGLPGKSIPCSTDAECVPAFGCTGSCKVTAYDDEDFACLQGCIPLPDGGGAHAAAEIYASFAACVASQQDCTASNVGGNATTTIDAYLACVEGCERNAVGSPITDPVFASCIAASNNCLSSDPGATVLVSPCSDVDPPQDGGVPAGGLDGGALLLTGEVRACNCTYLPVEGDRHMYLKSTGQPVAPRWQGPNGDDPASPLCGPDGGVISQPYMNVSIAPCVPLLDSESGTGVTKIQVLPVAALGPLACASDAGTAGTVTSFDVLPDPLDAGVPARYDIPCNAAVAQNGVGITQGIAPNVAYDFVLRAYTDAGTPAAASCCFATAQVGIEVTAACDPVVAYPDAGPDGGAIDTTTYPCQ